MKKAEKQKNRTLLCCFQNKRQLTPKEKKVIYNFRKVEDKLEKEFKKYALEKEELAKETFEIDGDDTNVRSN